MRKIFILLCIVLTVSVPLMAGTFDLGISLGTNVHLFERSLDPGRMKLGWGVTAGLTDTWELDVQVATELIPTFFGDSSVRLVLQHSLLGQRSTGTEVAGMGVNTLFGGGVLISPFREDGAYGITHLLVSLTPITIGSPMTGKRERLLGLTLAYNLETKQVGLLFDLVTFDFYMVGTYRDYR